MTENDEPNLDDVMVPTEEVHPDRHQHGKMPNPIDDDELERRTEHEREEVREDQEHRAEG
jgi:hypothetical protein